MPLKIIGAGFGRTGTESMKRALEMLGYGPCYHMYEVMPEPTRYQTWLDLYDDRIAPDWDAIFEGYQATVDWPACAYWRDLAAHFPEAKVLLTVRSAESWYASMEKTILTFMRQHNDPPGMAERLAAKTFGGRVSEADRDHIIDVFTRHNAEVQAAFGPERLLTYHLGSGWKPLCDFLDVPVPDAPYPRGNHAEAFHDRDQELTAVRRGAAPGSDDT